MGYCMLVALGVSRLFYSDNLYQLNKPNYCQVIWDILYIYRFVLIVTEQEIVAVARGLEGREIIHLRDKCFSRRLSPVTVVLSG